MDYLGKNRMLGKKVPFVYVIQILSIASHPNTVWVMREDSFVRGEDILHFLALQRFLFQKYKKDEC